ncbi:hypothetical protein TNIN_375141 [Trichonephila inaurata madagascariensis]|uniref:Uncharacterized protein n=1 Tax=Trichonephila inaurata madagascariensis TaxID=2747483 RepID=A0A8X6YU78_9ARAC|nr:hypothetical protein TNIN_465751 [Trichonephila inaurata madagascariensis]GFY77205.1 hypothetical protein TNIN_375141 [Trichonephila inaurata madagascariensis]
MQNTAQFFAQFEILLAKTRITADKTKHRHVIVTTELEVLALISGIVVNLTPIVALKNVVKSSKKWPCSQLQCEAKGGKRPDEEILRFPNLLYYYRSYN